MAVGKNKKLGKKGKMAGKKKRALHVWRYASSARAPRSGAALKRPRAPAAPTPFAHHPPPAAPLSAAVDPFTRKEWYDIKAPGMFSQRVPGKTPVTKTTGQSAFHGLSQSGGGRGAFRAPALGDGERRRGALDSRALV